MHSLLPSRLIAALALMAGSIAFATGSTANGAVPQAAGPSPLRPVVFVGNNWDGTATVFDPTTFAVLRTYNVIPDIERRLRELRRHPADLAYFYAIRQLIGEGHNQYVDDMFTSHDGRFVYVSRPSLADVVSINLKTGGIVWRFPMEGHRSDHMAISPDGTKLLVSDSTANKVHVINPFTGREIAQFASGDSPHENNFSQDGKTIFHASIGLVYTPLDRPAMDSTKGDRWFEVVDGTTYKIEKRLDIGQILEKYGYPNQSSAVRPMAIAPGERIIYMQLSFLHGFVKFDIQAEKPLRLVYLPELTTKAPEQYVLDSAHHGLAINPAGTKLCVAGTMDGYAAIVHTDTYSYKLFKVGTKPYWSTNSADGKRCYVSFSANDRVSVFDYATEKEIARVPVGDHPQRVRAGVIRSDLL